MELREPFVAYGKRKFTEEEYLELEFSSEALKEYILIDSESVSIEVFRVNSNKHRETEEYNQEDAILSIQSLHASIPVKEIYEGTKLL